MTIDSSSNVLNQQNQDLRFNEQWTEGIFDVLDRIRVNCYELSELHSYKYVYYKEIAKAYRIPIIVLSGINTFAAVGLDGILTVQYISIITSLISLTCGIITAVELYLNIQKRMENELISHKDYYKLSLEIYKTIKIEAHKRGVDGKSFLDEKFNAYEKLLQNSNDATEYSITKTDYLTPPLMDDIQQLNTNQENKVNHFLKFPSLESFTAHHWHQMKKERAKRSEMRSHQRYKSRNGNLVGIPENYSENDEHSECISLTTQEDDFPITAVIKEKENNNINEINNKV